MALWETAGRFEWVNPLFTSYPTEIVASGIDLFSRGFTDDLLASLWPFVIGYTAALVIGIPLGLALGRFRVLRLLTQSVLMAAYTTPRLALLPILLIWLGIGTGSTAIVVFLGGVFPILVTAMAGVVQVNKTWVSAAQAFGAREREIFAKVILPSTLPYIFSGVRLGLGRALLGVVVSEMYVSQEGVGHVIMRAGQTFQTGSLMFVVFFVGIFGALLVALTGALQRRVVVWRDEVAGM